MSRAPGGSDPRSFKPASTLTPQEHEARFVAELKAQAAKAEHQKQKADAAKAAAKLTLPASEGVETILGNIATKDALAIGLVGGGAALLSGAGALAFGMGAPAEVGALGAGSGFNPKSSDLSARSTEVPTAASSSFSSFASTAMNAAAGAFVGGAVAGPAGAAFGAVVGMASGVGSTSLSDEEYAKQYAEFDKYKTIEGVSSLSSSEIREYRDPEYRGTIAHASIANEQPEVAMLALKRVPKLANEVDKKGRPPIQLALATNGNEKLIEKLLNLKTAAMVDNDGVSTLAYAAMFSPPEVFAQVIDLMSDEERVAQLSQVDSKGKSFIGKHLDAPAEYLERFSRKFSIEARRAENAASNTLFYRSPWQLLLTIGPQSAEELIEMARRDFGLTAVKYMINGQEAVGFLSNNENLQRIKGMAYATDSKSEFWPARKAIERTYGIRDADGREMLWGNLKREIVELEKEGGLSEKSLLEAYESRMVDKKKIFKSQLDKVSAASAITPGSEGVKAREAKAVKETTKKVEL